MTADDVAREVAQRLQRRGIEVAVELQQHRTFLHIGGRRFVIAQNAGTDWVLVGVTQGPEIAVTPDERGVEKGIVFIVSCLPTADRG